VDGPWLKEAFKPKIQKMDWKKVVTDVTPFLKPEKKTEVEELWSEKFFLMKTGKLSSR
jgi:hypothetical protein